MDLMSNHGVDVNYVNEWVGRQFVAHDCCALRELVMMHYGHDIQLQMFAVDDMSGKLTLQCTLYCF